MSAEKFISSTSSDASGTCPGCEVSNPYRVFYFQEQIPTQSCLLARSAAEALAHQRGDLQLVFCENCGLVFNSEFAQSHTHYRPGYEDQQRFSPTFNAFSAELVTQLRKRYSLSGGLIVEVGCGKGDFLEELCSASNAKGLGIDPAWQAARTRAGAHSAVSFIGERFKPEQIAAPATHEALRLLCCRHTLEHIAEPLEFMRTIRAGMPDGSPLFLEVPSGTRILQNAAFEDVYYEHCNYFTEESLTRLLLRSGFSIERVYDVYESQYLCAEATAAKEDDTRIPDTPNAVEAARIQRFSSELAIKSARWRDLFLHWKNSNADVVIWGSGSKCVAFLESLDDASCVTRIVDINPYRAGLYAPGSRWPIEKPEVLRANPPDTVVLMNSAYKVEVAAMLRDLGIQSELVSL